MDTVSLVSSELPEELQNLSRGNVMRRRNVQRQQERHSGLLRIEAVL